MEVDFERLKGPAVERAGRPSPVDSGQGAPVTLESFRAEHLGSVASLRALYRQAVSRGLVAESEGSLIAFCSTAALCLRVGRRPAALFVYLVKRGKFPATLADEDRACLALKRELAEGRNNPAWLKRK